MSSIMNSVLNSLKILTETINDIDKRLSNIESPIRETLYNNLDNTSGTVNLSDSVYNYSYLFIQPKTATHYCIVPIYSDTQTSYRGFGGWAGDANVGTAHIIGSITNNGRTLSVRDYKSIVHNSSSNHTETTDRHIGLVIGIR